MRSFAGKRKVRAVLTEFKPSKLMALEFSDDFVGQRVVVEARSYHDRALLQTTIYSRRRSFLYQVSWHPAPSYS